MSTDIQMPIGDSEDMESEHIVQSVQFPQISQTGTATKEMRSIEFLYDIGLQLSVELGRAEMTIKEVMDLGIGTVIELNKLAGEPLEIYVNGKLVARGEAVVINEKFGIRLTDVVSPAERVKKLK